MTTTAAPLVLLPGMNCSARLWSALNLDREQAVHTPRLTEPTLTKQVDRLLDELPPRVTLMGLSLGAIVAMALTRTAPERVADLVLLSTNPYGPTELQFVAWRTERDRLSAGVSPRDIQRDLLPVLLTPASLLSRPDLVATTLAMADDVGAAELDAQLSLQATRIDERSALREVRCPTLVVAGAEDRLCPVQRHREIADLVPGSRLHVLEGAGHLSPLERPEALQRVLDTG